MTFLLIKDALDKDSELLMPECITCSSLDLLMAGLFIYSAPKNSTKLVRCIMGILFSEVPVNGFCQRQCAALENVVGLTLYAKTWVTPLYFLLS